MKPSTLPWHLVEPLASFRPQLAAFNAHLTASASALFLDERSLNKKLSNRDTTWKN